LKGKEAFPGRGRQAKRLKVVKDNKMGRGGKSEEGRRQRGADGKKKREKKKNMRRIVFAFKEQKGRRFRRSTSPRRRREAEKYGETPWSAGLGSVQGNLWGRD